MSVVKSKRYENQPIEKKEKFEVFMKARELLSHTLKITSNLNVFKPEYDGSLQKIKVPVEVPFETEDGETGTKIVEKEIFVIAQGAYKDCTVKTAEIISSKIWAANNTRATNSDRWHERKRLQIESLSACVELRSQIFACKKIYHLRGGKVKYWNGLVKTVEGMIQRWHESDYARYKELD